MYRHYDVIQWQYWIFRGGAPVHSKNHKVNQPLECIQHLCSMQLQLPATFTSYIDDKGGGGSGIDNMQKHYNNSNNNGILPTQIVEWIFSLTIKIISRQLSPKWHFAFATNTSVKKKTAKMWREKMRTRRKSTNEFCWVIQKQILYRNLCNFLC